jgi:hypothetical protein
MCLFFVRLEPNFCRVTIQKTLNIFFFLLRTIRVSLLHRLVNYDTAKTIFCLIYTTTPGKKFNVLNITLHYRKLIIIIILCSSIGIIIILTSSFTTFSGAESQRRINKHATLNFGTFQSDSEIDRVMLYFSMTKKKGKNLRKLKILVLYFFRWTSNL